MIYPGPVSIAPGAHPGGLVVHFYRVPDQTLLRVSMVGDDAETVAETDGAALADEAEVCLVFYDGDTGQRMRPGELN